MPQVSLRLPEVGYQRLRRLALKYDLTYQAIFEANAHVYLNLPDTIPAVAATWREARRLQNSPDWLCVPRQRRVNVNLDDELFLLAQLACERHQVTQNVAFGLVVMPWCDDADPAALAYCRYVAFPLMIAKARELSRGRRRASRTPSDSVHVVVTR